ncbi:MAG: hypothetical protein KatS3mg009_1500 [Acidimicrobiia bacterium]|nr:MAG: hypothetical protein KatS3mg009_1500 [Acidimicrobiia bacterium]
MILVDRPVWGGAGDTVRCAHLASDTSYEELHRFVEGLRLPRPPRFHGDHYDVAAAWWDEVVAAGATVVSSRELVRRLRDAGLRRTRRDGVRGAARARHR